MRYLLLLIGGAFLTGLALFSLPEQFQSQNADYDRGFNEGFQLATAQMLETAQRKGAGEYYYDEEDNRLAFRWYTEGTPQAVLPEPQDVSTADPVGPHAL